MSWFSSIFSGGSILNPVHDFDSIFNGTKNLIANPGKQFNKFIEPAAITALPLAAAGLATLATGGLASPLLYPAIAGAAGTYGGEIATQGLGALTSGKPPSIGDFAIGAGLAAGTYGLQSLLSPAIPTVSTATSTAPNLLSTSGFNTAMANIGTAGSTATTSGSFLGSVGSTLSGIGSALGSGLTGTLDVLGTAAKVLTIAATGMEAYSLIQSHNTAGQCNSVQSQAQQFGSIAQTFNSDYQAVTASNAQQTLSTLQSLYSQANQLGQAIISSGSACVDSTVTNQIQQTLSQMQTAISNLETALGQTSSTTPASPATTSTAPTTTSTNLGVSSTCTTNQQQFSNLVGGFNSAIGQPISSNLYSQLSGLYQQAYTTAQAIQADSTCGTASAMSIIDNNLSSMQTQLQQIANELTAQGVSTSSIQPSYSSSVATPTSSSSTTNPVISAIQSNPAVLPILIVGGTALVGGLIWYAVS